MKKKYRNGRMTGVLFLLILAVCPACDKANRQGDDMEVYPYEQDKVPTDREEDASVTDRTEKTSEEGKNDALRSPQQENGSKEEWTEDSSEISRTDDDAKMAIDRVQEWPNGEEDMKASQPVADSDFVRVADYIPDIGIDLKYATEDNFTGQVIYSFSDAYLRYGTVKKLQLVQGELALQGKGLKIWDGYRPVSAQFKLWEVCPNPVYVANPNTGYSSHSKGGTVDITLISIDGTEVPMPTGFDDFTERADRDYRDCDTEAAENAQLLETVMVRYGFTPYFGEWWHYTDTDTYPVEMEFEPH